MAMSGERSRNAFATPSVRFSAPGPSVETHTPGLRSIWPLASAMNAATASWRTRMNSMPTFRAASMKSRISPPGRPNIRSTPASRSVAARTSAHVGIDDFFQFRISVTFYLDSHNKVRSGTFSRSSYVAGRRVLSR